MSEIEYTFFCIGNMLEGSFSVVKEMATVQRATIELWMDFKGWLSTQEVRVALGYRLVGFLRLFRARDPSFA